MKTSNSTSAPSWFAAKPKHTGIVYFDGVCGMCNSFIDFLIRRDKGESLQFASLQGETAKKNLEDKYLKNLNTVVYQEGGIIYFELDAIIRSLASIGGVWKLISVFRIVPSFIGNGLYRLISRNRYKWFGRRDVCRMPTTAERGRILE